ncbi:MAG: biotin--[acetyl-CoA-carboxylase] ligase, partial [Calditrichaeota bacterium]
MRKPVEQHYDPDEIAARLEGVPLVSHVQVYQSISSTNAVARRLADAGAPGGTLILADQQTAGKGRFGRKWESPPGVGLWFSLLLRPANPHEDWYLLPMVLSETLALALSDYCRSRFTVKWPNDILHA